MIRLLKDRRRAQAGTTLVELLVSVTIMGFALVLIVGTISTGLLNSAVAKRNTATEAVVQYELDSISGSQFNGAAQKYSECFATENNSPPMMASGYLQPCQDNAFSMRADVSWTASSPTVQVWTIAVVTWPGQTPIGAPTQVYKVDR
ncbi:MAG TPA: type II secretion system protein [Candidatus Micrarchaeaceae archaeon]|nr:type II secretion system protein [Candidatus Micrarchaeaceae archaeon]